MGNFEQCNNSMCVLLEKCALRVEIDFQAQNGGYQNQQLTKPAGPYWPKGTFQKFTDNLKGAAQRDGCVDNSIEPYIDQVLARKDAAGELV